MHRASRSHALETDRAVHDRSKNWEWPIAMITSVLSRFIGYRIQLFSRSVLSTWISREMDSAVGSWWPRNLKPELTGAE
jgi:hypothetical protein